MKAITYTYRNCPQAFVLRSQDDDAAKKLFQDILDAMQGKREMMLIVLPDGLKMITPCEIIDMMICDATSLS